MDNNNIIYKISCIDYNVWYKKLKTRLNKHIKNIRLEHTKNTL